MQTANFKDVMETINSITGHSSCAFERSSLKKTENEIEDLKIEVDALKQIIHSLDEQFESNNAELEAQLEIEKSHTQSLMEDVAAIDSKSQILEAYIGVLKTEDFKFNLAKNHCAEYIREFWAELKYLSDQGCEIKQRVVRLKELQEKCLGLSSLLTHE